MCVRVRFLGSASAHFMAEWTNRTFGSVRLLPNCSAVRSFANVWGHSKLLWMTPLNVLTHPWTDQARLILLNFFWTNTHTHTTNLIYRYVLFVLFYLWPIVYYLLSINEVLSIIYCLLMKINLSARRSSFIRVQASTIWLSKEMLKTRRADTRKLGQQRHRQRGRRRRRWGWRWHGRRRWQWQLAQLMST